MLFRSLKVLLRWQVNDFTMKFYALCIMSHPGCNLTPAQFQVGPALKECINMERVMRSDFGQTASCIVLVELV